MKKQEALNRKVFIINFENEIEETTLYAHIKESEDTTTTPRGVAPRIHIRENKEDNTYEIWTWGVNGNNPKFIETFETEEEAEESIFQGVFEYDFMQDDQRDTDYFLSEAEAIEALKERE